MNWVQITEVLELLDCAGNYVLFSRWWWEFGYFCKASVNVDRASGLGGGKEEGPGFFIKTANKKGLCFLGSMLEGRGSKSNVFLERIPVCELFS